MIFELCISVVILNLNSIFCTYLKGGWIMDLFYFSEILLLFLILVILAAFIFLSGYSKAFFKIFYTRKKFSALQLYQLKQIETSLDYASKIAAYEAIFFILIGTVFYYINWQHIQTLGFQLSLIIKSAFLVSSIEIILFVLKAKLKNQMILYMSEDEKDGEYAKKPPKQLVLAFFKVFLCIVVIISVAILTVLSYTRNESSFKFSKISSWIDIPSILFLIMPFVLLLFTSGLFKNFFLGIKSAFSNQKLSVSKKLLYINANKCARAVILLTSFTCTLTGYYAVLKHLDFKEAIGTNMMLASVSIFYAIFINLFLLTVESKLEKLSEKTGE